MPIKHTASSHNPGRHLRPLHVLILMLPALLSACGGGGGSENTQSAAPQSTTVQSTAPLPAPAAVTTPAPAATAQATATTTATAPADDASCGLNLPGGIRAEVLQRVNALRASGSVCGAVAYPGVGALSWNANLLQAAKGHATDMATNNYFSHTGRDGRSPAQRVLAAGYSYGRMGENIAAGQPSVESVMAAWIDSPSHCQNMMTPDFADIAVACVRNDAADYRIYWVMEMGRPR